MVELKTATVMATMNRQEVVVECIHRLAAQSRPPELVVATDNASTDGTAEALRSLSDLPFPLIVLEPGENLGNAGGVELAMEHAFGAGADAVWILDDDSWPEPDALEKLLDPTGPSGGVRASLVIDPATGEPSWPCQVEQDGAWVLTAGIPAGGAWVRVRRAWLGALISREVREKVGRVNGALFLRGEDEDYPRRIEDAGFSFHLATGSRLHHPPGGALRSMRILGREVMLEAGLSGAKLYYRLRNAWWMTADRQGQAEAVLLAAGHLALMMRDGSLWRDFATVMKAAGDAAQGRLGRRDDL